MRYATKKKPKPSKPSRRVTKPIERAPVRKSEGVAVVSGNDSGKGLLDLSCVDWEHRIAHDMELMPDGLVLDEIRAERAKGIFDLLKLPDVPGQPRLGEAGAAWFRSIVGAVFGTWNGKERSVNEYFILVPKKNSKTTNSAGIMVTALIQNERPRAEFLLIAPTQTVANTAFQQAVGMIQADEALNKMFEVKDYIKQIVYTKTNSILKIKSFDPSVVTGSKPAGVLLDELHVIAENKNADRVIGQLRGGLISQPEAFMITITTQSERVPLGIFKTELDKARKVRDGLLKLKLLPILYEFPHAMVKSGEWRDPKNWWMVTPNRGKSVTIERMQEDYVGAVSSGEEELRRWASQHLNVQIGVALKSDSWIGASYWLKTSVDIDLDQLLAQSEIVTVGIDGGGLDDMLGLAVVGRHAETKKWYAWCHAWVHQIAIDRRKELTQSYKDFAKEGSLTICEKLGEDIQELGDIMEVIVDSGKLDKVGVDQSGLGMIIDEIEKRKVSREKQIVGIQQGWRLTSTIKTTERKLAEGTLLHATQGVTRFAVESAKVEPKGNAVLITKANSGSAKIDTLMALFDAVELMSRNPAGAEKKYQILFAGGN